MSTTLNERLDMIAARHKDTPNTANLGGVILKAGSTLDNGWLVIDVWFDRSQERFGDRRPQGFVLALDEGQSLVDRRDHLATWSFVIDERGIVTTSGHYFSHIFPAAKDFARRIGSEA